VLFLGLALTTGIARETPGTTAAVTFQPAIAAVKQLSASMGVFLGGDLTHGALRVLALTNQLLKVALGLSPISL
jgi:hypothetical protein